ncbi:hypothetical protein [Bradyrhizobium quebecense]|uniref:Uncharacterized protein n=2 Tax=Bradyrhizobium quebecense TaxID=2748629 RepID=A0ACD3VA92_9BRAD|nr:hypothetical protein [Bradyrhizobium quebecense]UGY03274.1 hypothetical protein J4P68_0000380 [Bradyrhizobium quebecense]
MTTAFNKLHGAPRATDTDPDESARAMELRKAALGAEFSHASYGNMPNAPAARDIVKRQPRPQDASRRRELGEVEIEVDGGRHRVDVAHDPARGELRIHGATFDTAEIDRTLMRSFEATAAELNRVQGQAEDAPLREALGALLDRILRRHKFTADAVTRQLRHAGYSI